MAHLVPEGDDDGNTSEDIDHGKQDHPGRSYLLEVKIHGIGFFESANLHVNTVSRPYNPLKIPRSPFWLPLPTKSVWPYVPTGKYHSVGRYPGKGFCVQPQRL